MTKAMILNDLQEMYNFKTAKEFADFLGISNQTLSNWKSRDTYDAILIYTKCESIDGNWLLSGKGPKLRKFSDEDWENMSLQEQRTALTEIPSEQTLFGKYVSALERENKLLTERLKELEEKLSSAQSPHNSKN